MRQLPCEALRHVTRCRPDSRPMQECFWSHTEALQPIHQLTPCNRAVWLQQVPLRSSQQWEPHLWGKHAPKVQSITAVRVWVFLVEVGLGGWQPQETEPPWRSNGTHSFLPRCNENTSRGISGLWPPLGGCAGFCKAQGRALQGSESQDGSGSKRSPARRRGAEGQRGRGAGALQKPNGRWKRRARGRGAPHRARRARGREGGRERRREGRPTGRWAPARGARPPLPAPHNSPCRRRHFVSVPASPASGGRCSCVAPGRRFPRPSRSEGRPRRWPAFPWVLTRSSSVRRRGRSVGRGGSARAGRGGRPRRELLPDPAAAARRSRLPGCAGLGPRCRRSPRGRVASGKQNAFVRGFRNETAASSGPKRAVISRRASFGRLCHSGQDPAGLSSPSCGVFGRAGTWCSTAAMAASARPPLQLRHTESRPRLLWQWAAAFQVMN